MKSIEGRTERLAHFLDAVSQRPLVWGVDDCLTGFLANWILQERGVDPAAGHRGRYHGFIGCALAVNRAGGLVSFVAGQAKRCGLRPLKLAADDAGPADPIETGAVAVIKALTEDGIGYLGGIRSGEQWAIRATGGLFFSPASAVAAWAI